MPAIEIPRRRFLTGLAAALAAPAVVKASSLMPIKADKLAFDLGSGDWTGVWFVDIKGGRIMELLSQQNAIMDEIVHTTGLDMIRMGYSPSNWTKLYDGFRT